MQSTRGTITTNVAMVECAGGQNQQGRDIFLLSELEKVWVAVSILVRKRLLDGRDVQIPHLGTLCLQEKVLFSDHSRSIRYFARKLSFFINHSFAIRFSVDTGKVPIEKVKNNYSKIALSEIVDVCGVPAKTASKALKEFVLYIGEGLHNGKVFHIHLPGVASLTTKKELVTLTTTWEMQMDLFSIDSRKWSPELQVYGREMLRQEAHAFSTEVVEDNSARPGSQMSPESWRAPSGPIAENKFVPAAPSGRLFSDIEREAKKRQQISKVSQEQAKEMEQLQARLDNRIRHYDCMAFDEEGNEDLHLSSTRHAKRRGPHHPKYRTRAPSELVGRAGARESIYDVLEGEEDQEPDIEEVVELSMEEDAGIEESTESRDQEESPNNRFLKVKDANLEQILREEEPFSRPISRQGNFQHSSVRDLIYGSSEPKEGDKENRGKDSGGS
ncbi:hypothetical protein AGDE_07774 [Angomonas deanei]|nr:hypothetical protein AGDE_07774 [Angomonas deanei]|eukprot:EPY34862.1 hypothetical protein AGDE_07774 [Angomonas deanei]